MESDRPEGPEDKAEAIVSAADAFMNRLRPPAEEDVPLLTDVVDETALPAAYPPSNLSAAVQAELSQELEDWLDMRLTGAILKVLDSVADQLVARISEEARADLLPRLQAVLGRDAGDKAKG